MTGSERMTAEDLRAAAKEMREAVEAGLPLNRGVAERFAQWFELEAFGMDETGDDASPAHVAAARLILGTWEATS
jgi:hypothetical protein